MNSKVMIKRRRLLKALVSAPVLPVVAQQAAVPPSDKPAPTSPAVPPAGNAALPAPFNRTPAANAEAPKLEMSIADEIGDPAPGFFKPQQMACLRRLGDEIMPKIGDVPGALEARAPEFLDFLISESPKDRQQLYTTGLDLLDQQSQSKHGKAFSEAGNEEVSALLSPLREPWTYDPPTDPLAHFLRIVRDDLRNATMSSREYARFSSGSGRRRGAGVGMYWYPLD